MHQVALIRLRLGMTTSAYCELRCGYM